MARPPKPFHKPIPERRYQSRIRNRIFLEPDRAFLDEITTITDGEVTLARELSRDELARLKKLAKEARKNRGAVRTGKLVIFAILAGAVVAFNFLFRNQIAERGAERLLESIFGARAELSGVSFRPLAGELSFDSLAVADVDRPMTNLFELGEGRLDVRTWPLLSRRVIVRNLTVSGLEFGTPRETSGALADSSGENGAPAAEAREALTAAGTAARDTAVDLGRRSLAALGLPQTLDASEFLEEQLPMLESPSAMQLLIDDGSSYLTRWESEIRTLTAAGRASAEEVSALATTDFTAIRSVEQAIALIERSEAVYESTAAYARRVESSTEEAIAEARAIVEAAAALPQRIEADYALLRAQIPEIRGGGRDFLVGLVELYLAEQLGGWYERALLAWELAGRLRAVAAESAPARVRRTGRIVSFGEVALPGFELSEAFITASGRRELELTVEALSSDPDLTGRPTTVMYQEQSDQGTLSIGAVIDRRSSAITSLSLAATAGARALAVDRGLDALDLDQFRATTDVDLSLVRGADGRSVGTVAIRAGSPTVDGTPAAGSIGELVRDVLTRAEALEASFSFAVVDNGAVTLADGKTNLDEQIAGVVQERIDATLAAFEARVEAELQTLLGPSLAAVNDSLADVIDLRETAEELARLATDREAAAAALQARAAQAASDLRFAVEAEAQQRVDEARRQAETAAREQAERAQQAAEEAAREAADRAAEEARDRAGELGERLRLPGF